MSSILVLKNVPVFLTIFMETRERLNDSSEAARFEQGNGGPAAKKARLFAAGRVGALGLELHLEDELILPWIVVRIGCRDLTKAGVTKLLI
jgi:hypothetical protein